LRLVTLYMTKLGLQKIDKVEADSWLNCI